MLYEPGFSSIRRLDPSNGEAVLLVDLTQNITGNLLTPTQGNILFVFTSALMFALRFSADFIERKIGLSPPGLLCVCAVLACIGLYGVMAFVVARRTKELGVRMALGARPGSVVWLVMKEVLVLLTIGLADGEVRTGPVEGPGGSWGNGDSVDTR